MLKNEIYFETQKTISENNSLIDRLIDKVSLIDYAFLARKQLTNGGIEYIWTEAFNKALSEHQTVIVPFRETPYLIDGSIIMHSDNRIEAHEKAVIRQKEGVKVLLIRNEHVVDQSASPTIPDNFGPDRNISISGGIWEESNSTRKGYGKSGMYDEVRSMYGISCCMLFSNVENLTLTNITISHAGGFAIQTGNAHSVCCENITFRECYADGIHINGNTDKVFLRNVEGKVGDDIIALNMFDWKDSSINFGPIDTVWCENIKLHRDSPYKAIRILPGIYKYPDGKCVDCSARNIVMKNVQGINNIKLYLQTEAGNSGSPDESMVGSGDNIFFDDIFLDVSEPIDKLENYLRSDPVTGSIAAFEFGANIGSVYLENIQIKLSRDKFPMSFAATVGPKSSTIDGTEIFDPYVACTVKQIFFKNISINGTVISHETQLEEYLKSIDFSDSPLFSHSAGHGTFEKVVFIA